MLRYKQIQFIETDPDCKRENENIDFLKRVPIYNSEVDCDIKIIGARIVLSKFTSIIFSGC
jgi:hypothetical protein